MGSPCGCDPEPRGRPFVVVRTPPNKLSTSYRARLSNLPLGIYLTFYFVTGVIGAVVVTIPPLFDLWSLMFPTMDARWLAPGSTPTYWIVVLGPLVILPFLTGPLGKLCRWPAIGLARSLGVRPSPTALVLVASLLIAYCILNLSRHGYLGVGLFSSGGTYQENIIMRTQMFSTLGEIHFGIIYVGVPALTIASLYSAVRDRRVVWWVIFFVLCTSLLWLYSSTLTKGNLVVFGIAVIAAGYHLGIVKLKGLFGFAILGLLVLTFLDFLLSGTDPFAVLRTLLNVAFRVSSGIPFYLAVFPEQVPYVGLDVGLSRFGIGPDVAANQVVANYMFPGESWVQSAAPAPAHVMAYAQGGILWSVTTMFLIGALTGFASALGRVAHSPLACSAFVGACMACYYTSQTEFAGSFQHSYGYFFWMAALAAVLLTERFLRAVIANPQTTLDDASSSARSAT